MGERWTAWANEPWRAAAVAAAARQEAAESRQEEAAAVPWPFEESERQCSGRSAEDLRSAAVRSQMACTQISRCVKSWSAMLAVRGAPLHPRNLEGILEETAAYWPAEAAVDFKSTDGKRTRATLARERVYLS